MNELMNFVTCITPMKPKGSILRWSMVRLGDDGKDLENYYTSCGVRTLRILAQIVVGDFAASHSVPYMAYIAHAVTGVSCGKVSICDTRVYKCLCLAGRVSFST